ncbi:hypothetical protein C6T59_18300 [Burkholderia multivorans]|uniref:Uncharacterized protein n=1 Tax=Burkholderia multivorans TaxID=87883 RepID=A0AB37AUW5_9BURK|nr:hypothetical protein C6P97_21175 [Burkholderia multivorans]PRE46594.1 hypothetical protein C6P99_17030 [Burkholderia multivorans]PRF07523.1 hypothetical protein C6Q01_14765 [Burkholderia multivorans]PRF92858.1 hypothetical protein C6Q23_06380 [Burkholderia multivorans]PRG64588.1 hypothetical protein C6T59_18300 [Burkholderia multivorans]
MARSDAAGGAAQPVVRRANTAFPRFRRLRAPLPHAADMRVRCANALTNASLTHFSIAANRAA